jgi:two-component system sensor histidine kinase BaeS
VGLPGVKSLFQRIFLSFFLIIFITVILSTGIEFLSTREELPRLLTEIRTKNIAHILGVAYTREKGWDSLNNEILWISQEQSFNENTPSIRIIVRDSQGRTLYNSFTLLVQTSSSPLIEGGSVNIMDYETGERAGTITAYVDKAYLDRETADYILSLLKPRLLQGALTALVALLLAFILSRSITKPITALTGAAENISLQEHPSLLPVNSRDELGRMGDVFNRMIRSLEVQRELRKRLINDVSHEILSPLNVIRLEARGLLDGISSPEEGGTHIISEVDRLKNLVNDLDWLAETDGGEYRLNRELISPSSLMDKEIALWQLKAEVMGKSVMGSSASEIPKVLADPLRISQALGNLIDNALKYSSPGSLVEVTCYQEGQEIILSVKDSGPGISLEDQPHLFERFYRADKARTPHEGGRGLGLAIVKQIMELHGGRIWFSSLPGGGSTFFLSLPCRNHQSDG